MKKIIFYQKLKYVLCLDKRKLKKKLQMNQGEDIQYRINRIKNLINVERNKLKNYLKNGNKYLALIDVEFYVSCEKELIKLQNSYKNEQHDHNIIPELEEEIEKESSK